MPVFRVAGPLLAGVLFAAGVAAQPHPFTANDLVAMDRLSDAAVSPDGARVVFTLSALDSAANTRRTDLWVVGIDGSGLRQLTNHQAGDTGAVWHPDGKSLFFLSTRSGSSQVWRLPVDGGEPEQVTSLPLAVGSFVLSRDGRQLAVSMEVFLDCDTPACTAQRLEAASKRQATGRLYDRVFIRHWNTWADGRRSHVFVVPVAGGTPVDIMRGMDADAPSKPFGGAEEFTFTPDGLGLVFTARDAGREEAWSTDFDLYLASIDGKGGLKNLTSSNKAWDTGPVFSPDGKTLAYRAMARPGFEADRFTIVLRPWPDGASRVLTQAWDRSSHDLVWAPDGKSIYTSAENVGQLSLFAVSATTGEVRTVVKDGYVSSPAAAGPSRLAFFIDDLKSPAELHVAGTDGNGLRKITNINAPRLAAVKLGDAEQYSFKGWNNETVYGWVVKPVDFDPSKKYPIAFLIHGGPQGSFSNTFHYRWNPQAHAGAGFAVVMIDFHGSTGYGQAFTDSIRGDWGGKPLEDLQKGLDAAIARYPWLDGGNACALGGSYGGYMVNWIAGNWPDRFKCLVSHDGNLDERFAYYTTEELWFPEWEHRGTPWENAADYGRHNPIDHVAKWKTPMLVVHGEQDFRVVYTEGIATFTALQRRGIPSQLLVFPDEGHWVLKPANSILWHETVIGWLRQWLGSDRAPSAQ